MSEILLYYRRPDPTTWVYLSSFLTVGLFFVFHRVWSVRNADLVLLILLGPGVLIVQEGYRRELVRQEQKTRPAESFATTLTGPSETTPQNTLQNTPDLPAEPSPAVAADPSSGSLSGSSSGSLSGSSSSIEPVKPVEGQTAEQPAAADATETLPAAATSNLAAESFIAAPAEQTTPEKLRDPPATNSERGLARVQLIGFIYLFVVEILLVVRLMLDPLMVRRPRLDPNLTSGGLTFIGVSLFIFMMANVVNSNAMIQRTQGPALGPGYALINMLPTIPTRPERELIGGGDTLIMQASEMMSASGYLPSLAEVAKTLAIIAHAAIVIGIVLVSNRHFGNIRGGMGCATLYLMLPYTAQMTGRVDHALPAALLLWAVLFYRRPMVAGIFIGLAAGLVYYPLFLLPLWMSFYWRRGLRPFIVGVTSMLALLMILLSVDQSGVSLVDHLQQMFGILNPLRSRDELQGFWHFGPEPIWRLPVIVGFVILSLFFAIWPAQKNLGTLIAGSATIMVAAQFWHGYGGGLYIAWFLPLLLLTVFRPNLQDRVATKVVRMKRETVSVT